MIKKAFSGMLSIVSVLSLVTEICVPCVSATGSSLCDATTLISSAAYLSSVVILIVGGVVNCKPTSFAAVVMILFNASSVRCSFHMGDKSVATISVKTFGAIATCSFC